MGGAACAMAETRETSRIKVSFWNKMYLDDIDQLLLIKERDAETKKMVRESGKAVVDENKFYYVLFLLLT